MVKNINPVQKKNKGRGSKIVKVLPEQIEYRRFHEIGMSRFSCYKKIVTGVLQNGISPYKYKGEMCVKLLFFSVFIVTIIVFVKNENLEK
jgi:hypothetical protein